MKMFLQIKHWQLFILTFGINYALVVLQKLTKPAYLTRSPLFEFPIYILLLSRIIFYVTTFSTIMLISWLWAIGVNLAKKHPGDALSENVFKRILILKIGLTLFQGFILPRTTFYSYDASVTIIFISFAIGWYCYYFIAKRLKSIQKYREVGFSEIIGEFFALAAYPIGIWFIQPRVNTIFDERPAIEKNTRYRSD